MILIFPIFTFSRENGVKWRQFLLLVLCDTLCQFLKKLVTRTSKLKKLKYVYVLKRYSLLKFEFPAILLQKLLKSKSVQKSNIERQSLKIQIRSSFAWW